MELNKGIGVSVGKIAFGSPHLNEDTRHSHRLKYHAFVFVESGSMEIETDFKKHTLTTNSLFYTHPDQIRYVSKVKDVSFYYLSITDEALSQDYVKILNDLIPSEPVRVKSDQFSIIKELISLSSKLFAKDHDSLYKSILLNNCNSIVALAISELQKHSDFCVNPTRHQGITKSFKLLLETHYRTLKSPSDYSQKLNLTSSYLNKCVNKTTGFSTSHQIQERIIVEAKRLLYYTDKTVKEIAYELGYTDPAYFSRLFTKLVGMSANQFRQIRRD